MKSNNQIIYIYETSGKLKGTKELNTYAKSVNRNTANVLKIATSFKGYGYDNGFFISTKPLDRLLTSTEVMKMFDKWLRANLKLNEKKLINMYKKNYDEEILSQSLLYISEAIVSERSVNDFEQALVFKYKTLYLNSKAYNDMRNRNGFTNDFTIKLDDGNEYSYIDNFAKEGQSLFNSKPNYDCIEDYNSIKQFDVIGYILKETVSADKADLFVEVLQSNHNFNSFNDMPEFPYAKLVRTHKDLITKIKGKEKISCTEKLKQVMKECWDIMITQLSRIKEECARHTFVKLEDYSLKELIQ
jgi:hypothetical protein